MFQRLQQKWKVSAVQVILILCTFAIGGSLTGYAGKKIMNLLNIEQGGLWLLVYIIIVTLIWPFSVLLISVPFGQYHFFTNYLRKMGTRMGLIKDNSWQLTAHGQPVTGNSNEEIIHSPLPTHHSPLTTSHSPLTTHIAIFASGAGSNAQKIIDHFRNSDHIKISLIVCNKPGAGILTIAAKENIPALLIEKEKFFRGNAYIDELRARAY